ncbi:MAG: SCO family protein, partial [Anaerolineales bacterium]
YFGYTYCPDICPTTLAEVKLVFEELGDRAEDINLIMVTVDPERDTPEVLQTYLNRFHPRFLGLWGEGRQLEDVMAAYGVFAQKEPSDDPDQYLVSHTARLFLIDQQGYLRTNYSFGTPREEILSDLTLLLDEENQQ